jgi:EamA-like transporter family
MRRKAGITIPGLGLLDTDKTVRIPGTRVIWGLTVMKLLSVGVTPRRMSQEGHPLSKPKTAEYMRGSLYGLAAVSIWAAWIVAVRLGIRTSLQPWDITAIRFGVAGLILLPYLLKKGLAVDRLGWVGLRWSAVRAGSTRSISVYRPHTLICHNLSRDRNRRGLHRC